MDIMTLGNIICFRYRWPCISPSALPIHLTFTIQIGLVDTHKANKVRVTIRTLRKLLPKDFSSHIIANISSSLSNMYP